MGTSGVWFYGPFAVFPDESVHIWWRTPFGTDGWDNRAALFEMLQRAGFPRRIVDGKPRKWQPAKWAEYIGSAPESEVNKLWGQGRKTKYPKKRPEGWGITRRAVKTMMRSNEVD